MLFFLVPFFLVFLFSIVTSFFCGFLYLAFCFPVILENTKENFFRTFSFSIAIGYVLITSIIAVYYTVFNTIFIWPFIVCFIPLIGVNRDRLIKVRYLLSFLNAKNIWIIGLISLICFVYNAIVLYRPDGYLFYDLVFYGKIARGILEFGTENIDVIFGSFVDTSHQALYHYGDLWMTGFLSNFFDLSEAKSLVFITYSFLHVSILLLMISIFYTNKKGFYWCVLLAFGLLYGLKLFVNINFDNQVLHSIQRYRGFPYPIFNNKLLPIYVLTIFSIALFKLKLQKHAFAILSFIPIFYSVTIPVFAGIFVSMLMVSIVNLKYKIKYWDISIYHLLMLGGSIVFIVLFSKLSSFKMVAPIKIQIYSVKTYFVLLVETIVKVFSEYVIVLILLLYFMIKRKSKIFFNPLIFLSLSGLFAGFIFVYIQSPGLDTEQALSNVSPVLLLIIGIEVFSLIGWKYRKILVLCFLLCGICNLSFFYFNQGKFGIGKYSETLSESFTNGVSTYSEEYEGKIISCSINTKPYELNQRWRIDLYNNFQDLFQLNRLDIPLEIGFLFTKGTNLDCVQHPYYQMYEDEKITEERILHFLKVKKVNHLFINDSEDLPDYIILNSTLLFKDGNTKGSFWKFNSKGLK